MTSISGLEGTPLLRAHVTAIRDEGSFTEADLVYDVEELHYYLAYVPLPDWPPMARSRLLAALSAGQASPALDELWSEAGLRLQTESDIRSWFLSSGASSTKASEDMTDVDESFDESETTPAWASMRPNETVGDEDMFTLSDALLLRQGGGFRAKPTTTSKPKSPIRRAKPTPLPSPLRELDRPAPRPTNHPRRALVARMDGLRMEGGDNIFDVNGAAGAEEDTRHSGPAHIPMPPSVVSASRAQQPGF